MKLGAIVTLWKFHYNIDATLQMLLIWKSMKLRFLFTYFKNEFLMLYFSNHLYVIT